MSFLNKFIVTYGSPIRGFDMNGQKVVQWIPGLSWAALYKAFFRPFWQERIDTGAASKPQIPVLSTFNKARASLTKTTGIKVEFELDTEQKICPDCYRFAVLLKPASHSGLSITDEDRELLRRAQADHLAFCQDERSLSTARFEQCKNALDAGQTPFFFPLYFDGARAFPAFRPLQHLGVLQTLKKPASFMFLSMVNPFLGAKRIITSARTDLNKGANTQCTIVWEEMRLALRRAQEYHGSHKFRMPQVRARTLLITTCSYQCVSDTRARTRLRRRCEDEADVLPRGHGDHPRVRQGIPAARALPTTHHGFTVVGRNAFSKICPLATPTSAATDSTSLCSSTSCFTPRLHSRT
jgi:hypothetical protein